MYKPFWSELIKLAMFYRGECLGSCWQPPTANSNQPASTAPAKAAVPKMHTFILNIMLVIQRGRKFLVHKNVCKSTFHFVLGRLYYRLQLLKLDTT